MISVVRAEDVKPSTENSLVTSKETEIQLAEAKKADDDASAAAKKAEDDKSAATKKETEDRASAAKKAADEAAATNSPVQSAARPFGLAIVDSVKLGGSDAASANFQINVLPSITNLINTNLKETASLKNATALMLDPSKLKLATDSNARVYFVVEGAGYRNSLAFNFYQPGENTADQAASRDVITEATRLIFPNASSSVSSYDPASKAVRTASYPLLPGDFVDLGTFRANGRLDLALIANGSNGGRDVFVASPARNEDHIGHVVSFALKDSPYLIVAFEDMRGGGDRDYNDVIVAIDIGRANVAQMVSAPVPPLAGTLTALLGVAVWWRRRLGAA